MKDDESQTETPAAKTPAEAPALRCRLNGERFHSNGVPQRLLKALEGLFRDAVRRSYLQDNPGRRRLPRGYISEVDIKISTEDGDKTYVSLTCNGKINSTPTANGRHRVEEACDDIAATVRAPQRGLSADDLPAQTLNRINQLRNGLAESESIVFLDQDNQDNGASLSPSSMAPYYVPGEKNPRRKAYVSGVVTQVDQFNGTFQITKFNADKLIAPLPLRFQDEVADALKGNKSGKFIHVRGLVECGPTGAPLEFLRVDGVEVTEMSTLGDRLDELRALEDGWLDGEGVALSKHGLDWVEQVFTEHYPQDLLRPSICPTPEGDVLAEWHLGKNQAMLEIDLETRMGWWYIKNYETGDTEEKDFDLTDDTSWNWMEEKVRLMERTKW